MQLGHAPRFQHGPQRRCHWKQQALRKPTEHSPRVGRAEGSLPSDDMAEPREPMATPQVNMYEHAVAHDHRPFNKTLVHLFVGRGANVAHARTLLHYTWSQASGARRVETATDLHSAWCACPPSWPKGQQGPARRVQHAGLKSGDSYVRGEGWGRTPNRQRNVRKAPGFSPVAFGRVSDRGG